MNKKLFQLKKHSRTSPRNRLSLPATARAIVLVGCFVVGGFGVSQQVNAAQSMSAYCSQYKDQNNDACRDGVKGIDCNQTYSFIFGSTDSTTMICKKAAADRAAGIVSLNGDIPSPTPSPSSSPSTSPSKSPSPSPSSSPNPTPTPSPTPSPSESPSPSPSDQPNNTVEQALSGAKDLSQYIDILHDAVLNTKGKTDSAGQDSPKIDQPDNNYGSYVNGANKQQKIIPLKPGTGNSPAILFFNGGGWHANDGMGENVAGTVGPDSSMYNNTGAERAGDRGYALYDVTYRLGSSGVYYMLEDVMRGIQHMRNNASLYGIDPNKIVIWGDSAGGSLAMRAAASGKSGAKVAVGWSAPTNAYTALFFSIADLAIGIDHSTCIPTDLAGLANLADKFNGGNGDVAEYGQGLTSNDFSSLGISLDGSTSGGLNPLSLLTEGISAGKDLLVAAKTFESVTGMIKSKNFGGLASSTLNLASKTFAECIDNFNAMSPALFASPDTPPTFIADFDNDGIIPQDQTMGMRDKLRQLGIRSEGLLLPGNGDCLQTAPDIFGTGCHLGYHRDFVTPTLNFIDSVINNDWQPISGDPSSVGAKGGGGNSGGGGSGTSGGGSSSASNTQKKNQAQCATIGSVYVSDSKNPDGGSCQSITCNLQFISFLCNNSGGFPIKN